MPTTKGKVYLGEQLICHTLTDIETETLAFEQMNASDLPYCSSKAATSLRPVQPGYCLNFDGVNDYVDTGVEVKDDSAFECLLKKTASAGTKYPFGTTTDTNNRMQVEDRTGVWRCIIGTSAQYVDVAETTGVWGTIKLFANGDVYYNGVSQGNTGGTMSLNTVNLGSRVMFGARAVFGSGALGWWAGNIAQFKTYRAGVLESQYNNDFSTGTVAIDSSGNGNDGTLVNGPTWTTDNSLPYSWLNQVGYNQYFYSATGGSANLSTSSTSGVDYASGEKVKVESDVYVEVAADGANQVLILLDRQYALRIDATGHLQFALPNIAAATADSNTLSNSTHYTVAAEFDSDANTVTYYIDGVEKDTVAFTSNPTAAIGDLYIPSTAAATQFGGVLISSTITIEDAVVASWDFKGGNLVDSVASLTFTNSGLVDIYIPRDEATPANDAFGNALEWSGSAFPRRPEYRGSYAGVFGISSHYIQLPVKHDFIQSTGIFDISITCSRDNTASVDRIFYPLADIGAGLAGWRLQFNAGNDTVNVYCANDGAVIVSDNLLNSTDSTARHTYRFLGDGVNMKFYVDGVLEDTSVNFTTANFGGSQAINTTIGSSSTSLIGSLYGASIGDGTNTADNYLFTEGVGATAHDISGNGNDGTIVNASTATEGAGFWAGRIDGEANAHNINNGFSRRMLFDGVDDEVSLANESNFDFIGVDDQEFEVMATVVINPVSSGNYVIFSKGHTGNPTQNGAAFRYDGANNNLEFRAVSSSGNYIGADSSTVVLDDGKAHDVVLSANNNAFVFTVDGITLSSTPVSGGSYVGFSNGHAVRIGQTVISSDKWAGVIYNVSFSEAGVIVSSYLANGNTNADWLDTSGNGNNGTVAGSPALLRVPADSAAPTLDVYGTALTNPAVVDSNNNAETTQDVYNIGTGDVPCPESNSNSGLSAIAFDAVLTADDSAYMHLATSVLNDRLIAFSADLTGGDKTLAEKYTE